jgi:hypothetical protein
MQQKAVVKPQRFATTATPAWQDMLQMQQAVVKPHSKLCYYSNARTCCRCSSTATDVLMFRWKAGKAHRGIQL